MKIGTAAKWFFAELRVLLILTIVFLSVSKVCAAVDCSGVPDWSPASVPYAVGVKVTYNGELYKCLQAHTSQANWFPAQVPALWTDLGACSSGTVGTPTPVDCSNATSWSPNFVSYTVGTLVDYNNELYQCLQAHRSQSDWFPPQTPALWRDMGPCPHLSGKVAGKLTGGLAMVVDLPPDFVKKQLSPMYGISTVNGQMSLKVFVETTGGDPGLSLAGAAQVIPQTNDIYVADIPLNRMEEVAELPGVVLIEPSFVTRPNLDVSVADIKADVVHNNSKLGITGSGAIVGVVDTGIDLTHLDFTDPTNASRVKWLEDQSQTGFPKFTTAAAISGSGETDTNGHGTHVASIAASSGRAPGNLTGVAPGASIYFVKSTFVSTDVVTGVQDIFAARGTTPAVVNLSLGSFNLGHDGTSLFETSLDAMVTGQQAIVVAAGNDGGNQFHTDNGIVGTVPATGTKTITYSVPASATGSTTGLQQWISCWYDNPNEYDVTIIRPDGTSTGLILNTSGSGSLSASTSGDVLVFFDDPTDSGISNEPTPANDIQIYLGPYGDTNSPKVGNWQIVLSQHAGVVGGTGTFDLWTGLYSTSDPTLVGFFTSNDPFGTLGVPATAKNVITVGAYVTKNTWTSTCGTYSYNPAPALQTLAPFSGKGPTRNQAGNPSRLKPDVTAPGMGIVAALSAQENPAEPCSSTISNSPNGHKIDQGTSMACPHVTGAVALMMAANPELTAAQIKTVLENTSRRDSFTGGPVNTPSQDNSWGFGKINALHAVLAVKPPQWAFSTLQGSLPLVTGVNSVAISPNFAVDHVVFAATAGHGLWKSINSGSTWTQVVDPNLTATDFDEVVSLEPTYQDGVAGHETVIVSTSTIGGWGNLFISSTGGAVGSWILSGTGLPPVVTGSPQTNEVISFAFSPNYTTDGTLFAGLNGTSGLYQSTNRGTSWTNLVSGFPVYAVKPSPFYSLGGADQRVLYSGTSNSLGGLNFSPPPAAFNTGLPSFPVPCTGGAVVLNPFISTILTSNIVGSAFQTFITGGLGTVPVLASDGSFGPPWNNSLVATLPPISALALSPDFAKDGVMFAGSMDVNGTSCGTGSAGGAYHSFDDGSSWTVSNSGFVPIQTLPGGSAFPNAPFPAGINQLAISPNYINDGIIFAATDEGLYVDPIPSNLTMKDPLRFAAGAPVAFRSKWDWSFVHVDKVSAQSISPALGQSTVISFTIDKAVDNLFVETRNAEGQVVSHMALGSDPAGSHSFNWLGNDDFGKALSPGTYQISLLSFRAPRSFFSTQVTVKIEGMAGPTATPTIPLMADKEEGHPTLTPTPTATATPVFLGLSPVVAVPNISKDGTPISFHVNLDKMSKIELILYNLTGEEIYRTSVEGNIGDNSITWDLQNRVGGSVASGLYVYAVQIEDGMAARTSTGKIIVFH